MIERRKEKPTVVKVGIATLALVWSVPTILVSATNGPVAPPEGHEDMALMYTFVFYLYFFLAVAVCALGVRYFYKAFFSVSDK